MKKILFIVIIFCSFVYIGCNDISTVSSYQEVKKKYNEVEIVREYIFIAKDSRGNIHYIECFADFNNGITRDIIVFEDKNKK